jgi:hypothetical protein
MRTVTKEKRDGYAGRRLSTQSTATYGRGKGLPHSEEHQAQAAALLGLGSSSKARKPDDLTVLAVPARQWVPFLRASTTCSLEYARASLEIAEASYKKAIRMQFDLNSLLAY